MLLIMCDGSRCSNQKLRIRFTLTFPHTELPTFSRHYRAWPEVPLVTSSAVTCWHRSPVVLHRGCVGYSWGLSPPRSSSYRRVPFCCCLLLTRVEHKAQPWNRLDWQANSSTSPATSPVPGHSESPAGLEMLGGKELAGPHLQSSSNCAH